MAIFLREILCDDVSLFHFYGLHMWIFSGSYIYVDVNTCIIIMDLIVYSFHSMDLLLGYMITGISYFLFLACCDHMEWVYLLSQLYSLC